MKLSTWAKKYGISYQTAWNWFKAGDLPVKAIQTPTGTILVYPDEESKSTDGCFIYCRVSTSERKDSLLGQVTRCSDFANSKGIEVKKVYKEIASGMNDSRPKLTQLLEQKPKIIIVENKDRLTRFGFNYIEMFVKSYGGKIIVVNESENDEEDLMKDLVAIITSFCCRLYGLRRAQNKSKKIKEILNDQSDQAQSSQD